jgi:hypothetical protein
MLFHRDADVEQVKANLDQRVFLRVSMAKSLAALVWTALPRNMPWMSVGLLRMSCRMGVARKIDIGVLAWTYVRWLAVKQGFEGTHLTIGNAVSRMRISIKDNYLLDKESKGIP